MKPIGLVSQIAAIGLATAIVLLFVRPTFAEIGDLQDEVQEYTSERQRVTETNQVLASRVAELESVSVNDRTRLVTYMPPLLDEVAILRDIEIIVQNAGVNHSVIQYNGARIDDSEDARASESLEAPAGEEFTVTVDGSYSRLKDFFSMLEQNEYPLQVYTLDVTAIDGGFLTADATIVTYIIGSEDEIE